jgi:putative flippase GtrA
MTSSTLSRLLKFSLVGGIGVGVQLGVLTALTAMHINYLRATVVAVECALVHNFLWHWRCTWSDRAGSGMRHAAASFLRFHVSNGFISLAGNLLLMRLLVGNLRLPVLLANLATIAACFVANFQASDRWVFFLSSAELSNRLGNRNEESPGEITSPLSARHRSAPASAPGCAVRMEHKSGPL